MVFLKIAATLTLFTVSAIKASSTEPVNEETIQALHTQLQHSQPQQTSK